MDSQEQMKCTVIGDAVKMASRIEALNKKLDSLILVSEVAKDIPIAALPNTKAHGISGLTRSSPSGRPAAWKRNAPSLMVGQEHA